MDQPFSGLSQEGSSPEKPCYFDIYLGEVSDTFEEDIPVSVTDERFRDYDDIMTDQNLAGEMFPPDYFILVE